MTSDANEVSFQITFHPRQFWIMAPLEVLGKRLDTVIDTGSQVSSLSQPTFNEFVGNGALLSTGLTFQGSPLYRLTGISVEGQRLPDVLCHVSPTATRLRVASIVGLNYLSQFRYIHFDLETARLSLGLR